MPHKESTCHVAHAADRAVGPRLGLGAGSPSFPWSPSGSQGQLAKGKIQNVTSNPYGRDLQKPPPPPRLHLRFRRTYLKAENATTISPLASTYVWGGVGGGPQVAMECTTPGQAPAAFSLGS